MLKLKDPPMLLTLAGLFAAGMLASCARIWSVPLPFGVCWIAALCAPSEATRRLPRHAALFALLGTAVSAALWQSAAGIYNVAAGLIVFVAGWALRDTSLPEKPHYCAVSALLSGTVTGLMILLSEGVGIKSLTAFLLQLFFLPVGVYAAVRVLEKPKGVPLYLCLFALISGSAAIMLPGGVSLGSILASGVVFSLSGTPLSLPMAALSGLALDWSCQTETSAVTVLASAGLAAGAAALYQSNRWFRLLAYWCGAAVTILLSGGRNGEMFLAFLTGGILAALLPPLPVSESGELRPSARTERLRTASAVMEQMSRRLSDCSAPETHTDMTEIYDRAAAQVCTRCASFGQCWRKNRAQTCKALSDAASAIEKRGFSVRTDFSERFVGQCRHFSALQKSINAELDAAARRRQLACRRQELQLVLCGQYQILSDYLRRLDSLPRSIAPKYEPRAFSCSLPRKEGICGDLTRELRQEQRYYYLLCDGMGTGGEAAQDSLRAAELLMSLLRAGMEPDDALELLNGFAILREEGGFSTVDLLCADLHSGESILYKWGGAPSYLRKNGQVKKVGTASFPPGLGVGGTQQAQRVRLSLGRGEVLILTSDGVSGEDAERLCRSAGEEALSGLAGQIVASGSGGESDDRTAVVLFLSPIST